LIALSLRGRLIVVARAVCIGRVSGSRRTLTDADQPSTGCAGVSSVN
jgi:hypothetical protein